MRHDADHAYDEGASEPTSWGVFEQIKLRITIWYRSRPIRSTLTLVASGTNCDSQIIFKLLWSPVQGTFTWVPGAESEQLSRSVCHCRTVVTMNASRSPKDEPNTSDRPSTRGHLFGSCAQVTLIQNRLFQDGLRAAIMISSICILIRLHFNRISTRPPSLFFLRVSTRTIHDPLLLALSPPLTPRERERERERRGRDERLKNNNVHNRFLGIK
jgi:hypothetical protein